MTEQKDPRPPKTPWLCTYMVVEDVAQSIAFYEKAFGFQVRSQTPMPEGEGIMHVEMTHEEAVIMFGPENLPQNDAKTPKNSGVSSPARFYIYHADVDGLFERAQANGATVIAPPSDMFWGDRLTVLMDPDGYVWTFARSAAAT